MTNNKKIEEEITHLKAKFHELEEIDPLRMKKELQELRHITNYVHSSLESCMDLMLGLHILNLANSSQDSMHKSHFVYQLHQIFDEIDFAKKVKIIEKYKLISRDMQKTLYKINDFRVSFAHVITQKSRSEMMWSIMRNNYLEKLQLLYYAMDLMNREMKEKFPTWYSNPVSIIEKQRDQK